MAQADGGAGVPSGDPSSWFQDETPAAAPAPSAASGPSSWFEDPLPASVQPAQAPDSTASTLLRNLKQGARDVDEAAGGIVSAPYSIGNALGWAIDKLGGPKQDLTPLEPLNTFAGPEAIQNDLSRAGLPPQPLTPNEQTAHAGITAGLEAAPFGPVQSAAGAVGGALGEKLLSELPPDTEPWKKALIGGLTGFGTGVLAAGGEAMRATTKAFTAAQQDVARQQALLDQRIEEHSAAQADKAQWQKKNQGLEHPTEPGVTETVFDAAKRAHAEAVQHAQDTADALTAQIASGLGPKQSPPALGKLVQGAVTDWSKNGMRQQIDDLEAPLAAKVPGDAEVEHGPLLRKLEELQGHHAGELAGPAEALFPASVQPLIDRFLAKFAGDEGGDMRSSPRAPNSPGTMPSGFAASSATRCTIRRPRGIWARATWRPSTTSRPSRCVIPRSSTRRAMSSMHTTGERPISMI